MDREHACDDCVLATGQKPSGYATHLLEIARVHRHGSPLTNAAMSMARRSQLEGRLLAVLDVRRARTPLGFARAVTLLFSTLLAVLTLGVLRLAVQAEPPPRRCCRGRYNLGRCRFGRCPLARCDCGGKTIRSARRRPGHRRRPRARCGRQSSRRGDGAALCAGFGIRTPITDRSLKPTATKTAGLKSAIASRKPASNSTDWKRVIVSAFKSGFGPGWVWRSDIPEGQQAELRLPVDDLPITGRLVDLEGRPLAGVHVECEMLSRAKEDDLSAWLDALKRGETQESAQSHSRKTRQRARGRSCTDIVTDADGRFRLSGIGRERMTELVFTGPTVARTSARVLTRPMPALIVKRSNLPGFDVKDTVLGCRFRTRPAAVAHRRRRRSRRENGPAPGRRRRAKLARPGEEHPATRADPERRERPFPPGRHAQGPRQRNRHRTDRRAALSDARGRGSRYPGHRAGPGRRRTAPRRLDHRSRHRCVSGQPVPMARLSYFPFLSNEHARALPEFEGERSVTAAGYQDRYQTAADGSYRLVGLPGRAIVAVMAFDSPYARGQGASEIEGIDSKGKFPTFRNVGPADRSVHGPEGDQPGRSDSSGRGRLRARLRPASQSYRARSGRPAPGRSDGYRHDTRGRAKARRRSHVCRGGAGFGRRTHDLAARRKARPRQDYPTAVRRRRKRNHRPAPAVRQSDWPAGRWQWGSGFRGRDPLRREEGQRFPLNRLRHNRRRWPL